MDSSKTLQIEELHLVNLNPDVSLHLKEVFTRISNGSKEKGENPPVLKTLQYPDINLRQHGGTTQSWIRHTQLEKPETAKNLSSAGKNTKTISLTFDSAPPDSKCVFCSKSASKCLKECGHMYCETCSVSLKQNNRCLKCSKGDKAHSRKTDESCPICLEPLKNTELLPCGHKLCSSCYQDVKVRKPQCPICQHIFGVITGNQPDGEMFCRYIAWRSLPGYEGCGTIEIRYLIPSGKQSVRKFNICSLENSLYIVSFLFKNIFKSLYLQRLYP